LANKLSISTHLSQLSRWENQEIEAVGLVDSGATVNVLPYELGLELGGVWDDHRAIIQLAGNLSN
jgi:hypothetical protein